MSFLDKMTKAVGNVVDRGKKDLDQFMRIQKVNGEISAIETKVSGLRAQVQQIRQDAGTKALDLVKAGSLQIPELQVFVEQLATIDRQVAVEEQAIVEKRADIERIKAEHAAAEAANVATPAAPASAPVVPPPLPVTSTGVAVPPVPAVPPLPQSVGVCPHCGQPVSGGALCAGCGATLS
jgi:hypothetical protein